MLKFSNLTLVSVIIGGSEWLDLKLERKASNDNINVKPMIIINAPKGGISLSSPLISSVLSTSVSLKSKA